MRFLGFLLLMVFVLVAAGWWLLADGTGRRAPIDTDSPDLPDVAEVQRQAVGDTDTAGHTPVAAARREVEPPAALPAASETAAPLFPITVRLVDGDTGEPVAGLPLEMRDRGRNPRISRLVSGAEGTVEVRWSGGGAWLSAAWKGNVLRYSLADSRDGELHVLLQASRPVVVEARRQGLVVPGLELWVQDGARLMHRPQTGVVATGAGGQATVEVAPRAALPPGVTALYAIADVIAEPTVSTPVTPATAGAAAPTVLEVPPTGRLEIAITGPDGRPYGGSGRLSVAVVDERDRVHHHPKNVHRQVRFDGGEVSLPPVEVGRRFRIEAHLPGNLHVEPVVASGPTVPGQSATAELRALFKVTLAARVLSGGVPVAGEELRLEMSGPIGKTLTTDSGGEVQWALSPGFLEDGHHPEELFVHRSATHEFASVTIPPITTSGTTRLPDVHLESLPALATGLVVDAAGQPIEQALVRALLDFGGLYPGSLAMGNALAVLSDAEGAFTLHGPLERIRAAAGTEAAQLQVRRAGFATTRFPVKIPAEDLRLVLPGTGRVKLTVDVSEPALLPHLRAFLVQPGEPDAPRRHACLRGSTFDWAGIPAGDHRLFVELTDLQRIVHQSGSVKVVTGETTVLPALRIADLRAVTVRVVDETGAFLSGVSGSIQIEGGGMKRVSGALHHLFLPAGESALFSMSAPGHRRTQVRVDQDQDIVLRPGIRVTLRLRDIPPDFEAGSGRVRVSEGRPNSSLLSPFQLSHEPFDDQGETQVVFSGPGTYTIYLPLRQEDLDQLRSHDDLEDLGELRRMVQTIAVEVEVYESHHQGVLWIDYPDD